MIILTKDNFESEVEMCDRLCLVDIYADWCAPCKLLSPIIDELERDYPDVKFCKINIDKEPELTALFKVDSIPMVAIVKDNVFVDFSVGYVNKETLASLIESNK